MPKQSGPGDWKRAQSLPQQWTWAAKAVYGNRVFIMGGFLNAGGAQAAVPDVVSATLGPDGVVGQWRYETPLPDKRNQGSACIVGNQIYFIGGQDGAPGAVSSTVWTAKVGPDGSLGPWKTLNDFPGLPRFSHQLITDGSRLFLLGGHSVGSPGTWYSDVWSCPVLPGGTLGSWTQSADMPVGLAQFAAIIDRNRIYVIGGSTTNSTVDNNPHIYTNVISGDGTLGPWQIAAATPVATQRVAPVIIGSTLMMLGGANSPGSNNDVVMAATIGPSGLGPVSIVGRLPEGVQNGQAVAINNTVFLIGGFGAVGDQVYFQK